MFVMIKLLVALVVASSTIALIMKGERTWAKGRTKRMVTMGSVDNSKKIVVTGLGIISPAGNTVQAFFDNICEGGPMGAKNGSYRAQKKTTEKPRLS